MLPSDLQVCSVEHACPYQINQSQCNRKLLKREKSHTCKSFSCIQRRGNDFEKFLNSKRKITIISKIIKNIKVINPFFDGVSYSLFVELNTKLTMNRAIRKTLKPRPHLINTSYMKVIVKIVISDIKSSLGSEKNFIIQKNSNRMKEHHPTKVVKMTLLCKHQQ